MMEGIWENGAEENIWVGGERGEVTGGLRCLLNEEFYILYSSENIIWSNKVKGGELNRTCSTHQRKINSVKVWTEYLWGWYHLRDLGIDVKGIKIVYDGGVRIESLGIWQGSFEFHEWHGLSWQAKSRSDFQGYYSMEFS
jgi:hypothetical protein